ncbi:LysR substrate-binding domain-containing protein [Undibacterium flavidum]|uniref:LysR family transcriptional regulator n=1 Tax=Undibacterium flavidum TaxID=2762297 RepID=A0ABR6YH12_9BURK|nr:LysR substrate-binding domain-containing protein [Undibacterium flavidum]MBC3875828.1 LysR family transcriptional regulator [Undibacterium flavidum]
MTRPIHIRSAPLGAIRAFEAAARLGSFKLAAQELSVTPAAISHQLAALEDYLGTSLFLRTNRLVQLTATGKILSEQVSSSFAQLQKALEQASTLPTNEQVLVVSAAPSIAAKWLVPRLSRFHAQYPDIDLQLSSENQTHDFIKNASIDVALRYGIGGYEHDTASGKKTGLHAEKLWEETYLFPVCSPTTLLAVNGNLKSGIKGIKGTKTSSLQHLTDLCKQTLLRLPLPPNRETGLVGERWQAWLNSIAEFQTLSEGEQVSLLAHAKKGPFYSHEHLAIDTAKSDHGICLALDVLVIEDLLEKKLLRPLAVRSRDPYSHWLLYREQDAQRASVQAFAQWIRDEAALSLKTLSSCRSRSLA